MIEALNTITASRWTLWRARWFGECFTTNDALGNLIRCYRWRGKDYFDRVEKKAK